MPADYATLATVYDLLGLSQFAETATPRLLDHAQRGDWMGRRILDLGCGTGAALAWLARFGYIVEGVDLAPEMLAAAQARQTAQGVAMTLRQQDIRQLTVSDTFDMALALNVLNELDSLRELEAVFRGVAAALAAGRMFIFSLDTLEGLSLAGREGDRLLHDSPQLTVVTRSAYDYERQALTRQYLIFQQQAGGWVRRDAQLVTRAYPVQAIAALLQRCGLDLQAVLTPDLNVYEPGQSASKLFFTALRRA